jgi:phosphatidylglycerol:prolipoprotein diacylglycerol transferase
MMPMIRIGSASIQTASLAFILALWISAFVAEREARRRNLNGDDVWSVLTLAFFVSVISGRLIYVAQNFDAYSSDWTEIFSLSPNTLAIEYGALCGLAAAFIFIWWKRIPFARFADALAIGMLAASIVLAVGQFLGGDGYGTPTDVPWAIQFLGDMRHPVQVYEAGLLIIGLIFIKQFLKSDIRDGIAAWSVIAWYAGTHLFIDAFRGDLAVWKRLSHSPGFWFHWVDDWAVGIDASNDKGQKMDDRRRMTVKFSVLGLRSRCFYA